MKIGYARVSTEDQKLDLQLDALRAMGCARIFKEKKTGASRHRPVLQKMLDSLQAGDVLMVWKLDRLGRSVQDLVNIVAELKTRGIGFHSLSDAIDTEQASGKLLFHIVGAIAEFERALISERTRCGMQAARKNGKRLGRRKVLSAWQIECAQRMANVDHRPMMEIAACLKVGRTTIWRALSNA